MDNPILMILAVAAIVAIAFGGTRLRSKIRSSTTSAGAAYAAGFRAKHLDDELFDLSATMVIHASEPVAREIVDVAALHDTRNITAVDDGSWALRHVWLDNTRVRLVDDPAGTRVQVDSIREVGGIVRTGARWASFRELIAEAAADRATAVSDGPLIVHIRREIDGEEDGIWMVADESALDHPTA